jgi:hypothetical protein
VIRWIPSEPAGSYRQKWRWTLNRRSTACTVF